MEFTALLKKMPTDYAHEVVYYLETEKSFLLLNDLLRKTLSIKQIGFECLYCNRSVTIYRQGHCYNCFYKSPKTAEWIMHPEKSKAHLGEEDRDFVFEQKMQLQPHVVYLSDTGQIKVGVTRLNQKIHRWIDQGASQALVLAEFPNRYLAGISEVALKMFISDKTYWKTMLSASSQTEDLTTTYHTLKQKLPKESIQYLNTNPEIQIINYPGTAPKKEDITHLKLSENKTITGRLEGIKGQYLLFDQGKVFNVRAHEGIKVHLSIEG